MSDPASQVTEHPLHVAIENLLRIVEGLLKDETGAERVDRLGHIVAVVKRVEGVLSRVDPLVAPIGPLDQGTKRIQQADSELSAYQSDRNPGRLENVLSHVGNLLLDVLRLPGLETPSDIGDLSESIVSFRRALGQHLRYADEEAEKVRKSLQEVSSRTDEIRSELLAQKERMDAAVSELQDQFSAAEDRRRQQFEEAIQVIKSTGSELQTRYEREQQDRKAAFATYEQTLMKAQEAAEARLEKEFTAAKTKIQEESEGLLKALEKDKTEAAKILGAIAQTGITKGFQRSADSERFAMRLWQTVTVLALLAFASVLLFFLPTNGDEFSWALFSQRVLVSLAFAGLAAFGAQEAAKHTDKERRYRRMELEFASVGPFLARLPKEKQDQAIEQIADRTFARSTPEEVSELVPVTTNGLIDIIRMAMQELLKGRK